MFGKKESAMLLSFRHLSFWIFLFSVCHLSAQSYGSDTTTDATIGKLHVSETPRLFTSTDKSYLLVDYPPLKDFFMKLPPVSSNPVVQAISENCSTQLFSSTQYQSMAHGVRSVYGCELPSIWQDFLVKTGKTLPADSHTHPKTASSGGVPELIDELENSESGGILSNKHQILRCQKSANAQICLGGDQLVGCFLSALWSVREASVLDDSNVLLTKMCKKFALEEAECDKRMEEIGLRKWPFLESNCSTLDQKFSHLFDRTDIG